MKKTIMCVLIFMILAITGCSNGSTFTNDKSYFANDDVYDCKKGEYSFPEEELTFKSVSVNLIDFEGLKENECVLFLEYKVMMHPTDNPYFEIDVDTCKLTTSQLLNYKETKSDLVTMLKGASCEQNTNRVLKITTNIEKAPVRTENQNDIEASLNKAGLTLDEAKEILNKISVESPIDECPEKGNQAVCLQIAWELAFKRGIPENAEVICELIKLRPELKPLCQSGLSKSLTQLEKDFEQAKKS